MYVLFRLAEFLADIAGVSADRISVVEGKRQVSELPVFRSSAKRTKRDFDSLQRALEIEKFDLLSRNDADESGPS